MLVTVVPSRYINTEKAKIKTFPGFNEQNIKKEYGGMEVEFQAFLT
jgi:hypothetical protein